jgi:LPXTG-site transpeptidase (sortase) family protein
MATGARHPLRFAAHALGNVLIGLALGLLVYYAVTDLLGELAQRGLADQVADRPALTAADPGRLLGPSGPVLDFAGWDSTDKVYWDSLVPGGAFGRLLVDAIRLDAVVVKGHLPHDLRKGPGWIDYTDLPGPTGNVGIAGHRTTYGAPFRRIDELVPGDTIDLYSPYRRYRYRVVEKLQVRPHQVEVMDTTAEPMLTLSACHPPYSAAYRLIVRSALIEVTRIRQDSTP